MPELKLLHAMTALLTVGLAVVAASGSQARHEPPPIVFVHGNGDTAGLWLTTIWRFESNGPLIDSSRRYHSAHWTRTSWATTPQICPPTTGTP